MTGVPPLRSFVPRPASPPRSRRPLLVGLAAVVLLGAGCGAAPTGSLHGSTDLARDDAARSAADDAVANATGTRFSRLGAVCGRVADALDGPVEWAGLHCTIAATPRWSVGMIDEGADADPFRRVREATTERMDLDGPGDEAWFAPDTGTLFVRTGSEAFFFTVVSATERDVPGMREVAARALGLSAARSRSG